MAEARMLLRIGESHPGQVEQAGKRLASGRGAIRDMEPKETDDDLRE